MPAKTGQRHAHPHDRPDALPADAAERARRLRDRVIDIGLEAMAFTPRAKVDSILRRWLPPGSLDPDDPQAATTTLNAVALATDLMMFAPSASGKTAIDRLLRSRQPAGADDAAAIEALRRIRFRLLVIRDVEAPGVFRVEDLATGESLRLFDDNIPSWAVGTTFTARLVPAGIDDGHVPFGAVVPLDEAGRAVAMGFVRPGRGGLPNPHRCAETVYRHVLRHGSPAIPGMNRPPEEFGQDEGFPYGPEDSAIDAIAHAWAGLPPEAEPPPDTLATARALAGLDAVIDALATSVVAREHGRDDLADAYARVAAVQMETLQRRATSGFGGDTPTLDAVAAVIDRGLAAGELPPAARPLFDELRRRVRVAPAAGGDDELDRLIQRIQALRAKTVEQGCTEQEAMAAAAKVGELLDRYGLSLSEIDLRQQACEGVGIETGRRRTGPIDDCVPTIAVFCDCRHWTERTADGAIRHVFFGLPADVEAAHYLYDLIEATFATETEAYKTSEFYAGLDSGGRRSATNSFQIGLARGIAVKLMEMHRSREDAMVRSTGRDLVPVKAAVVGDELDKLGLAFTVKQKPGRRRVLADAYHAGHEAGRRFDYRPAIREGSGPRR